MSLKLEFIPEAEIFSDAAKQYGKIWESEGFKILEIMEKISGLKFEDEEMRVTIYEGISSLNWDDDGNYFLKLRASYPIEVKRGTMVHELGHRLLVQLIKRPEGLDEHRILFLVLYDIWAELYGGEFANRMVEVEKRRKGVYDYELAWNWALSLTKKERRQRFKDIIK